MKKMIFILSLFFITSCASTNSYSRKHPCDKYIEPYNCYKNELDRRREVVYDLWNKRNDCNSLPELEAIECKRKYNNQIEIAVESAEKQSKLIDSYIAVKEKDKLRAAEDPYLYSKKETPNNAKDDYSELLLGLLSILNNSEPWELDTSALDDYKNRNNNFSNSSVFYPNVEFSIPDKSLLSVPLTRGLYEVDLTPLDEFIIRDSITGKIYKGRMNISQDKVLFENGMSGTIDSNGNFIFSSY